MCSTGSSVVIFTDLDATLLDHDSYDWSPAADALAELAARGIPVCPCTSKTVAEIEPLRQALGLETPFVAENGSVIVVPRDYFEHGPIPGALARNGLDVLTRGMGYDELRSLTVRLRADHGFRFTGFGEMGVAEVMAATGLDAQGAAAARRRDASEPLLWQDSDEAEQAFARRVAEAGATTRRGGRFVHVQGPTDKGQALNWLRARYDTHGPILAVALGDSANDVDMLAAADIGWWVARPDGRYQGPAKGSVRHAPGIGPKGWAGAIRAMIEAGEI